MVDGVVFTAIPAAEFGVLAAAARARAFAAADRLEQLRVARQLLNNGARAAVSSADDVRRAQDRADAVHSRLVDALRRSAAAHDRAADTLRHTRLPAVQQRVQAHRDAAHADRSDADRVASALSTRPIPPPAGRTALIQTALDSPEH